MRSIRKHKRVSRKAWKNLPGRKGAIRGLSRSRGAEKKSRSPGFGHSNDYLKVEFLDIPVSEIDSLFSGDNYRYLYESAKNYCLLLGVEFSTVYNPDAFRELYDDLDKVIPPRCALILSDRDGKLQFKVEEMCHTLNLFYIPCEILDETSGQFREILLQFFRILKFVHKLTSQKNSYHCEGLFQELEYQEELHLEGSEDEMDNDYVQLLKSYRDGDIGITLDQINEHPAYAPSELVEIIEKYTPADHREKDLLLIIKKGLNEFLLSEDQIFNYVGIPDFDPDGGCDVISADELIMIIYADDWVLENMIESINTSCENSESQYFCSGQIELTPNTDVLMENNDFVEPFLDWILELATKLYAYTSKDNDNE